MSESWIQILSICLANAGLILWMRGESRADWRHMDASIQAAQRSTEAKIDSIRESTDAKIDAIREEIKDFHGRLCAIEERKRRRDE